MDKVKKIVIVGPGAIGLLFYGLLSRSKEDIWLLDHDSERAQRLKKKGLKIEGLSSGKFPDLQIVSSPEELRDAKFWITCVKSYDTKTVIKNISPYISKEAHVVTFQNGMGNGELLSEAFGSQKVLIGATSMGATLVSEGVVNHAGVGDTIIGRIDGGMSLELKDLREIFHKAKLPLKITRDIVGALWSKLAINVGINALSALTRLSNGRLIEYDGSRRILREAVTEAVKVAKRKRIKLIYDDMLARAESVCEATSENISSMLADILKKKKTEIDFLNGAIVRHGESLGIKTPVNAMLVDLIKTIEASYAHRVKE